MTNRKQALEALRDQVKAGADIQPREFRVIAPEGLIANDELYEFWIGAWVNAEKAHNGSLDAAIEFHEALLPGWDWIITNQGKHACETGGPLAAVMQGNDFSIEPIERSNDIPARALLLCDLEALISETPDTPKGETP